MQMLLLKINDKLAAKGIRGEIGLYGGAVMCIAFNARESTHDIDAVFNPKYNIYQAAKELAEEYSLPEDWLNDSVKGFISENNELNLVTSLSNLAIYMASPQYMFAMKAVSCRTEHIAEIQYIKFLIRYLGIATTEQALAVIAKYYPSNRVTNKTFYFLMELFGD